MPQEVLNRSGVDELTHERDFFHSDRQPLLGDRKIVYMADKAVANGPFAGDRIEWRMDESEPLSVCRKYVVYFLHDGICGICRGIGYIMRAKLTPVK